jgi:zinc protease
LTDSLVIAKHTPFKHSEVLLKSFSPGGYSLAPDSEYVSALKAVDIMKVSGLGKLNQFEVEKKLARDYVVLSPWIDDYYEGFIGNTGIYSIELLLKLTYLYCAQPRKDEAAYATYMEKLKVDLETRALNPEAAFSDAIDTALSNNHFRKRPWTVELMKEMDLDASYTFFKDRFGDAGDFVFIIVGSKELEELKGVVSRYIGNLPSKGRTEVPMDKGIVSPRSVVEKYVYKGLEPKSRVHIVFHGKSPWSLENDVILKFLTYILRIRLREIIREDSGGTYYVRVESRMMRFPVQEYKLSVSFGCNPEQAETLSDLVLEEAALLIEQGPDETIVNNVKKILTRERERNLKENWYWRDQLEYYAAYDADLLEIVKAGEGIEHISRDDVHRAAAAYLDLDNYIKVILYPEDYRE